MGQDAPDVAPAANRLKFVSRDPYALDPTKKEVVDSIHVEPECRDKNGKVVPGRFDTAVVNFNNGGETGVQGMSASDPSTCGIIECLLSRLCCRSSPLHFLATLLSGDSTLSSRQPF